jgi:hypothetical protein
VTAAISYLEEILVDLNLENEYKVNLVQSKPVVNKNTAGETDAMEEEE